MLDIAIILLTIGVILIALSFFIKDRNRVEKDVEELSINLYEETNKLNRRLKIVEEELMIDTQTIVSKSIIPNKPAAKKPVHEIIVNQILALHKQGYRINEISKRSSMPEELVIEVLETRGVKQ
ncbi:hypothetical protein ACFOZY_11890 [Chungangia koreensis]|uniref:Resolvase HTH domain-containing protein n=1 Tax=Chungangia koreensis TaxID=752657 RepID=A0ABV8X6U6_9LACT